MTCGMHIRLMLALPWGLIHTVLWDCIHILHIFCLMAHMSQVKTFCTQWTQHYRHLRKTNYFRFYYICNVHPLLSSDCKSTSCDDALQKHTVLFSKHSEHAVWRWKMLASKTLEKWEPQKCMRRIRQGQCSASRPARVSEEGDAIQDGRGGWGWRREGAQICWLLRAQAPSSSFYTTTSAAVPPNAEAHLERLVTQLIKSSWGLWWDTASGMLRLWKGPE